ncbi:hypothetical protein ANN_17789 [Periplaneta americana]|uniref:Mos1 transposase HTH domain-containing protein n=1 Tax=Periplaneta americana TaxID=6978 RepID=A0ABQ8SUX8_PERAM|nr:hypothetical protein ANN_17789 [Periplaneta americana]
MEDIQCTYCGPELAAACQPGVLLVPPVLNADQPTPHHESIGRLMERFKTAGSIHDKKRTATGNANAASVLAKLVVSPSRSTKEVVQECGTSQASVEIFLEDHRRRELYIKRQKNMDSAFESIYYNIHQDTFSQSSSAAEKRELHNKDACMLLSSTCDEQRSVVRFLWAKGHNPREIHRNMCDMYGKDCTDHSNISRWCTFFADGRENLGDSPCSRWPVTTATQRNVTVIEVAILNDRWIQLQTLSQQFNISYGVVYDIGHDTLKFHKVSACWMPKNLTDDHKGQQMMTCLDYLRCYAAEGHDFLKGIVTGDESWAYHYTPETKQGSCLGYAYAYVLLVDFAKHGTTVNAAAYIQTLVKLHRALCDKCHNINADNARPHIAASVHEKINTFGWEVIQHPPYSPDLAPSDFHLFGPMKKFVTGHHFATDAEVQSTSTDGYTPTERTSMNRITLYVPQLLHNLINSTVLFLCLASVISQPQWEAPVQDSPAKLNVADWLSSVHNGSSPVNIINVATSRKEPVVIDNTAESESRRNTLEDLMKRINFQRSLLMTELAKQGNLTQGNLIPHIDNNLSHHTTSENDIFRTSSSFDENYDKLSSYEQIRDPSNGETLIETQQHIKPEGSSDKYENYKKEDVEMLIKRNTVEHDIGESREKELGSAEKSKKPSKENAESEKKDNCVSKGEENERIKVQTMLTHELNAHDLGSQPKIDKEESVTVLSEYSFDMSISKTQGHSGESSIENNDSNSASYEGVKIIVSVSELTEKKFQQTFSETSKESSPKTSPKTKKHDKVGRKLCKQKHKLSDKMPIEKERPSLQTSRHVSEKGTMTTETCHRSEEKKVQSIKNRGKKREDNYIKRSKWSDVINKDVGEAKDSSEVSTTYLSPPDQLSLSHIRNLVSSICNYKEKTMENASRIDPTLAIYISRLLVMSRESVENLNVSTSDVSTPDTETNTNNVTDTVSHRIPSPTQEKQTVEDTKRSKLYTDFRSDDVLDTRIQKQTSENSMRSKKYTELKIDTFLGSTSKQAAKCKTRNEIFTDFETGRAMDYIVQKETVKESTRNQTYSNLKSDSLILSEVEKQTSEDNIRSTIHPDLRNDIVMNTPLQKERFEVSTIIEINRDLKTDVTDTVEILTDTQREEAKVVSNRLSHSPKNTLLPLQTTRDSLMSDSYSFSEFRLHGTQNQSVSTPENVDRNNVIDKGDQLHSSCRCEGNLCEFNIQTPPFPSIIADMSLDEYKTFKFPEFFSEYAEKCSERISHLTKKIEEIRGEKKKLMASSSSSSSASSSSSSERGFDSTKYLSPPESSVVMTHVSNKDKGQTAPRCVEPSSQVAGISTDGSRIYESQEKEEKESVRIVPLLEPYDASVIDTGQKPRKDHHPHSRPPPCLWKHKLLQRLVSMIQVTTSFKVAELIAVKMKPHTIVENLIGLAYQVIVETMLEKEAKEQISKVPLSNNTIDQHVAEMSEDVNQNVIEQINASKHFALQVDESIDRNKKAQPQTARSAAVVERVRNLVMADRRLTVQEIAEEVGVSKDSAHAILRDDLNMNRVAAKFVPKLSSPEQKDLRRDVAQDLLDTANTAPGFLNTVITGDESWVYGYDPETKRQSSQWKHPESPRPKKARQVRSKIKVMLTVFFDVRGIVHHEYAPEGQTVTKEYYHDVLRRLRDAVRCKRPDMWTANNWHLHHDNAPAHSSQLIHTFLAKHGITTVCQPPYSPDLAPCDFWLFPKLKTPLKGSRFESRGEIMRNATMELNTIPKEDFQRCFRQWKDRWAKCVQAQGAYFEGD